MRERKEKKAGNDIIICSGCERFFAKKYKNRHQLVCPTAGSNIMLPMVSPTSDISLENSDDEFKDLLNILQLDTVGDYIKTDSIILIIEARRFAASKRKIKLQKQGEQLDIGCVLLTDCIFVFLRSVKTSLRSHFLIL